MVHHNHTEYVRALTASVDICNAQSMVVVKGNVPIVWSCSLIDVFSLRVVELPIYEIMMLRSQKSRIFKFLFDVCQKNIQYS